MEKVDIKKLISQLLKWWVLITLFSLFLILFKELSGHKQYDSYDAPKELSEVLLHMPRYIEFSMILGLIGTFVRKIYFLINSFLFFSKISSEPLSERYLKKKKDKYER